MKTQKRQLIKKQGGLVNALSPYNPAHAMYGDCCGIFNQINADGIMCCNEYGMTINELIDHIEEKYEHN